MQRTLQDEADNALDMADKATIALEEERAQLTKQNAELQQQLAALNSLAAKSSIKDAFNRSTSSAAEVRCSSGMGYDHACSCHDEHDLPMYEHIIKFTSHLPKMH